MGVRTTTWGPLAWCLIHGLCATVDRRLQERLAAGFVEDARRLQRQTVRYLRLLACLLPCIHCRKSYALFVTSPEAPAAPPATLPRLGAPLSSPGTFWHWSFLVHNVVNHKLGAPVVSLAQALENRWYGVQATVWSVEWLRAWLGFACYALSDYQADRAFALSNFLPRTCSLLAELRHPLVACLKQHKRQDLLELAPGTLSTRSLLVRLQHVYQYVQLAQKDCGLARWQQASQLRQTTGSQDQTESTPFCLAPDVHQQLVQCYRAIVGCEVETGRGCET